MPRTTIRTVKVTCPVCGKSRRVDWDYLQRRAEVYKTRRVRCRPCGHVARRGRCGANKARIAEADALSTMPRRPADAPTAHAPGSPGKIALMCERYVSGQELHHRDDAHLEPTPPPSPRPGVRPTFRLALFRNSLCHVE